MSKLPWVKWSFDRWEADMGPHPPEIVGWWSLMLGYLHRSETSGELTHDIAGWARIMRATPDQAKGCLEYLERSKIADVTFCNHDVTVVNRRMKRERLEKENIRLRVAKHRCNAKSNGDVTVKKKEVRSKKEDIKTPHTPQGGKVGTKKSDYTFDQFWSAYPKKTGKGAAKKAWSKINPSAALLQKILTALEWQTKSEQWTKDRGQFIPNPATYLNQERWEDEPPVIPRASPLSEKGQRTMENMQAWLEENE